MHTCRCPTLHTRLPQVGLLISDSAGNIATVRKSFTIAPGTGDGSSSPALAPSIPDGTSSSVNVAPVVKSGQNYSVAAGASFAITGVGDADGETPTLTWVLMEDATGASRSGSSAVVAVPPTANPGSYRLLVTATDGQGATGQGTARVTVRAASASSASVSPRSRIRSRSRRCHSCMAGR